MCVCMSVRVVSASLLAARASAELLPMCAIATGYRIPFFRHFFSFRDLLLLLGVCVCARMTVAAFFTILFCGRVLWPRKGKSFVILFTVRPFCVRFCVRSTMLTTVYSFSCTFRRNFFTVISCAVCLYVCDCVCDRWLN